MYLKGIIFARINLCKFCELVVIQNKSTEKKLQIRVPKLRSHKEISFIVRINLGWRKRFCLRFFLLKICPIRNSTKYCQINVANGNLHHPQPHHSEAKHCSFFAETRCLLSQHFCSKTSFTLEIFTQK